MAVGRVRVPAVAAVVSVDCTAAPVAAASVGVADSVGLRLRPTSADLVRSDLFVDVRVAAWTALGVLFGSYFWARIANWLPKEGLKLVFGFLLIYVAGYTVFGKEHLARSVILAAVLVVVAALLFGATRAYDRSRTPDATPISAASAGAGEGTEVPPGA